MPRLLFLRVLLSTLMVQTQPIAKVFDFQEISSKGNSFQQQPGCFLLCAEYLTFEKQSEGILFLTNREPRQGRGLALAGGGHCLGWWRGCVRRRATTLQKSKLCHSPLPGLAAVRSTSRLRLNYLPTSLPHSHGCFHLQPGSKISSAFPLSCGTDGGMHLPLTPFPIEQQSPYISGCCRWLFQSSDLIHVLLLSVWKGEHRTPVRSYGYTFCPCLSGFVEANYKMVREAVINLVT